TQTDRQCQAEVRSPRSKASMATSSSPRLASFNRYPVAPMSKGCRTYDSFGVSSELAESGCANQLWWLCWDKTPSVDAEAFCWLTSCLCFGFVRCGGRVK